MSPVRFLSLVLLLACAPEQTEGTALERLCRPSKLEAPLSHLISTAPAHWVENPASGAMLRLWVLAPEIMNGWTMVLVPPGLSGAGAVRADARRLAEAGAVVVLFDPDGRGVSEGLEDFGGAIQQAGLAEVISLAASLPCTERVGLLSFSFGVTMATGVFVDYPDIPIEFHVDWEGPAGRYSSGCQVSSLGFSDCSDEEFWAQREAVESIRSLPVPYHRLQRLDDHVQDDASHARQLLTAALDSGVPGVYLNDAALISPPASLMPWLLSWRDMRRHPERLLDWAERANAPSGGAWELHNDSPVVVLLHGIAGHTRET